MLNSDLAIATPPPQTMACGLFFDVNMTIIDTFWNHYLHYHYHYMSAYRYLLLVARVRVLTLLSWPYSNMAACLYLTASILPSTVIA